MRKSTKTAKTNFYAKKNEKQNLLLILKESSCQIHLQRAYEKVKNVSLKPFSFLAFMNNEVEC